MTLPQKPPEKQERILRELISKTTLANIAAFIIIIGGGVYGFITKNDEMVKSFAILAFGYLFGKSTK